MMSPLWHYCYQLLLSDGTARYSRHKDENSVGQPGSCFLQRLSAYIDHLLADTKKTLALQKDCHIYLLMFCANK